MIGHCHDNIVLDNMQTLAFSIILLVLCIELYVHKGESVISRAMESVRGHRKAIANGEWLGEW